MALTRVLVPMPGYVKGRVIGNSILVGIMLLVVSLRIVARLVTGSRLGWDDYFILVAVPQAVGLLVCQGLWSTAGAGYENIMDVPAENTQFVGLLFIPFEALYDICIVSAKLSVLFFYLRVFTGMKLMSRLTKGMMVLVALWGTGNLLQSFLACPENKCSSNASSLISTGLFNCTTNIIINVLPLYTIWSLRKLSISTRLGLTFIFVFSLNVTWVSILRIAGLAASIAEHSPKPMVVMENGVFLSVLEVNLSILCNSMPMLLPLYSYWRYRRFFGAGEDEYVSRIGGDGDNVDPGERARRARSQLSLLKDVTNGLPLETIYGKDEIHFTATVAAGPAPGHGPPRGHARRKSKVGKSRSRSRPPTNWSEENSETESTRRLSRNMGPAGIKIETKWTITEETRKDTFGDV